MSETTATRTLVKSPPELWAECSDASSLGRHLPGFGEITITRLDPETTVAWEGERVSGTVRIEPSGWGTRVTLTATPERSDAAPDEIVEPEPVPVEPVAAEPEPEPVPVEPEPVPVEPEPAPLVVAPPPQRKSGLMSRLLGLFRPPEPVPVEPVAAEPEPEPVAVEPEPVAVEPEPVAPEPDPDPEPQTPSPSAELAELEATLTAALDSLGQAHHRPFSRA